MLHNKLHNAIVLYQRPVCIQLCSVDQTEPGAEPCLLERERVDGIAMTHELVLLLAAL